MRGSVTVPPFGRVQNPFRVMIADEVIARFGEARRKKLVTLAKDAGSMGVGLETRGRFFWAQAARAAPVAVPVRGVPTGVDDVARLKGPESIPHLLASVQPDLRAGFADLMDAVDALGAWSVRDRATLDRLLASMSASADGWEPPHGANGSVVWIARHWTRPEPPQLVRIAVDVDTFAVRMEPL